MKIVVTGTRGIPGIEGGVETHCEELYPRLQDKNHRIVVVRRKGYAPKPVVKCFKGVRIDDLHAPRGKHTEAFLHTLSAVLHARRIGADVIHIHAIGPALLAPLARLLGMKVVVTHHGADYERAKWGKAAKAVLKLGERMAVRYAHHLIVISDAIHRDLQARYAKLPPISLIHNGTSSLPEVSEMPEAARRWKGVRYVLAVGRLVPEKGFDLLINAFKQLNDPALHLVIAGKIVPEDKYTTHLQELCKDSPRICLAGFFDRSGLSWLYRHATLFALPSSHEGLPIALLEAMQTGCPVVVSDIAANREVTLPENCYFHSGDAESLRQALKRSLADGGRKRYDLTPYDWQHIAGETRKVYDSLFGEAIERQKER